MHGTRWQVAIAAGAVLGAVLAHPATAQDGAGASDPLAGGGNAAVQALQAQMLADPATRERVLSLQDDPAVQQILKDPATMQALRAGDLGALLADPKLRALAAHPTVRGIIAEQQSR